MISRVWEPRDLIGEAAHSVTVKTSMPTVLSGSKEKLYEEAIVWQLAYVLQLPSKELAAMPYQLAQGETGTNITCGFKVIRFKKRARPVRYQGIRSSSSCIACSCRTSFIISSRGNHRCSRYLRFRSSYFAKAYLRNLWGIWLKGPCSHSAKSGGH